jgi:hypothetical protein
MKTNASIMYADRRCSQTEQKGRFLDSRAKWYASLLEATCNVILTVIIGTLSSHLIPPHLKTEIKFGRVLGFGSFSIVREVEYIELSTPVISHEDLGDNHRFRNVSSASIHKRVIAFVI